MATTVEAQPATDLGIRTLIAGDGVRGVGALFVFTTHVCLLADPVANNNLLSYDWAAPILGHIDLALSAFFVLSGYLIARPFTRAYVTGGKRPRIRSYVRNRILRVVPVFYFFTILVLLRFGLDGSLETGANAPDAQSEWWQVVAQFFFIQGQTAGPASIPIGPAWSIGSEVGFYFVIPLAAYGAYFVGKRLKGQYARAAFALAAIGFVFVVSIALRAVDKYHFAWLTAPPAIMYGFMPGVALGIIEPLIAAPLRERARLAKQLAWGAFALGLLCAIVYTSATTTRARRRSTTRSACARCSPRCAPACCSSASSSCRSAPAARRACSPTRACCGSARARTPSTSCTSGCCSSSTTCSAPTRPSPPAWRSWPASASRSPCSAAR